MWSVINNCLELRAAIATGDRLLGPALASYPHENIDNCSGSGVLSPYHSSMLPSTQVHPPTTTTYVWF